MADQGSGKVRKGRSTNKAKTFIMGGDAKGNVWGDVRGGSMHTQRGKQVRDDVGWPVSKDNRPEPRRTKPNPKTGPTARKAGRSGAY